jgi:ABC-type branched-subunit amino acid transport system ATPase component
MIKSIAMHGITIIAIEHFIRIVAELARRVVVLHHEAMLSQGAADDVLKDPRVVESCLGNNFATRLSQSVNA